jgi:N-acylglucosamine-6-phosphate 2-epimerase
VSHAQQLIARLRNCLVVSCQAPAESPLHDAYVMARLALAAEKQGAGGVRIDSPAHIVATRALVTVPIIGIHKQVHDGSSVYITPTCSAAAGVIEAGADIVAVDATDRHRPHGERLSDIIGVIRAHGRLVMADVATEAQGLAAADLGVDLIATTLSGYTEDSVRHPGPDFTLVERLATATRLPVIAEGRIRSANDVRQAFRAGAFAVVVGGAITGIDALVRHFVEATPSGLAETLDA